MSSCCAEDSNPFCGFIFLNRHVINSWWKDSCLLLSHKTGVVTLRLSETGSDRRVVSGFPFWGLGVLLILLKLSVTPADTLQKTFNTHNHLGDRAKWDAINNEQGLVHFSSRIIKLWCFYTKKGCLTEEKCSHNSFIFYCSLAKILLHLLTQ